ncbi:MAG: hypothetical protein J1F35_04940 [Erysipelotrichales bacterium]|nr:hypothetical protein [Erysipelotrichales bacterium]
MNNENNNHEVVAVNTTEKKVVTTQNINKKTPGTEKTMEQHMEENLKKTKVVVDWKTLFTYILLIAIVAGAVLLIFHLYDKYSEGNNANTTKATTRGLYTTTATTKEVHYETTTAMPTEVTHTVFDRNR